MLAVDLLHELELGVWKGLFTHLLRILAACNSTMLNEVDRRQDYRLMHSSQLMVEVDF